MQNSNHLPSNLLTVQQFNRQYPVFTVGSLRTLIFHSKENGFDRVITRISPTGGRGRILIDVDKFFTWLEEQQRRSA